MRAFYWFATTQFILLLLIVLFVFPLLLTTGMLLLSLWPIPLTIVALALLSAFSFGTTRGYYRALLESKIFDKPNDRSMHSQPVPRGGGWAFVTPVLAIGSLVTLFMFVTQNDVEGFVDGFRLCLTGCLGLIILSTISWRDDCKGVAVQWRMLAQLAATLPAAYFLLPQLRSNVPSWIPEAFILVGVTFIWVGFINLYNFMDGIDGITGTQTITISFGLYGLYFLIPALISRDGTNDITYSVSLIGLLYTGLSIGFLFHNWHPAKLFLGDIGSVTLGYVMGFCLLSVAGAGFWYVALTLPLYYLADGGITLARRILRGEKFWEAHRTHFYQRAAQAAGRHDVVVLKIAACNVVLIGIAMLELLVSPWFVLAAPLPVALLLHNMAHQRHIGVKSPNG